MRDLLKSFGCGMGHSIGLLERRWCHLLVARPIAFKPIVVVAGVVGIVIQESLVLGDRRGRADRAEGFVVAGADLVLLASRPSRPELTERAQRAHRSPVSVGRASVRQKLPVLDCGVSLLRIHRQEYPKGKHRFTLNNAPFLAIAGHRGVRESRDRTFVHARESRTGSDRFRDRCDRVTGLNYIRLAPNEPQSRFRPD
jgi:hypothetical protein